MKTKNYLNNKDILAEIHKSKNTYCSYVSPEYGDYDIILPSLEKINVRTVAEAKRNKAKKLGNESYDARRAAGEKIKQSDCEVDYKKINKTDLVFRIMTFDHIPDESGSLDWRYAERTIFKRSRTSYKNPCNDVDEAMRKIRY